MIKQLLFCLLLAPTLSAQTQCNNLLKNPGAEEGVTGWTFSSHIGNQHEGYQYDTNWSPFGEKAFVASHAWSTKSQEIDLTTNHSKDYLDSEPEIYVQEMYKGHHPQYNDEYSFYVELRDSLKNVLAYFEDGSQQYPIIANSTWQISNHTFSSYGPGLRYIFVRSGGKDVEGWSGNFGTDMDQAEVKFFTNKSITVSRTTLRSNAENATYQWLDCDNNFETIPNETNQSYTPANNRNYAVEINFNNCIDTSACVSITNNVAILENSNKLQTVIYPNPSSGLITIDLGNNYKDVRVTLKSISGHLISEQLYESAKSLNLEIDQPAGLYLIETITGSNKNSSLLKIVK